MTQPTDPLHEPFRLLRETSLAAGFEGRLAERLARAHREGTVRTHRFGGHRRTMLLLAAVALPAAAFASGGWLLEHRRESTTTVTEARREANPLPKIAQKPFSLPAPVTPPQLPTIEELPVRERSASVRERVTAVPVESKSRIVRESARPNAQPSAPAAQAPAKIESLDVSIPRGDREKASTGRSTEKPTNDSLGLRKSSEQGATRSNVERDRSSTQRESAGQQRGSDAAQQARERVQARERKGQ